MSRPRNRLARLGAIIREFFTLESASTEIARLGEHGSSAIARSLALAVQRGAAAEALHWQGHRVEALRLAQQALAFAVEAATRYVKARGESPVTAARALDLRGVPIDVIERFDAELPSSLDRSIPELDSEVGDDADELYSRLRDARDTLVDALAVVATTQRALARRKWGRRGAVVLAMVALVFVVRFVTRVPIHVTATASAVLSNAPAFRADHAVDGNAATYWLLPDRSPGFIDLRVSPPRRIDTLRIRNSTNPPYNDRATRDYTVQVFSNGRVAKRMDGHFDWADAPEPVEHSIEVDEVERIRIDVRTYHRLGAGLSEIEVE